MHAELAADCFLHASGRLVRTTAVSSDSKQQSHILSRPVRSTGDLWAGYDLQPHLLMATPIDLVGLVTTTWSRTGRCDGQNDLL